ncbi:MAG: hypothetical protein HN736_09095 [Anaerolineae bacterium]|jgi:hypothetical protein|nr:hypothetical protein [Anaerolineae bacterium]MBT3714523.1 hypothetical protein [Anaerolineae bacterium]MBT4308907.1 hypothetical protein [Anaerolineae bacterium]MBT4459058.1 hypothetical protein [Anaerolineae bacterium]MBT6061217.1 hypothetical protein [Anaerolineae bacterium]
MRILDKTPLIEEDGSISFINRIKGTLQYGFSWYPNLQMQQKAIAILEKQLSKKFTLIRNHTLENSKITIPIILIGPPGVQVIFVTHLHGTFRAKNDAWGTVSGGTFKEAGINLLKRTAQLGKALDIYLKRKEFKLPNEVEPILLSVNPALHVSTVRPIVRIVMSDAVDRFAASLAQESPVMSVEVVHEMAESIVNPRPPKAPEPPPQLKSAEPGAPQIAQTQRPRKVSRPPVKKAPTDYFGMTGKQLAVIGVMGVIVVCLLIAFILGILFFA